MQYCFVRPPSVNLPPSILHWPILCKVWPSFIHLCWTQEPIGSPVTLNTGRNGKIRWPNPERREDKRRRGRVLAQCSSNDNHRSHLRQYCCCLFISLASLGQRHPSAVVFETAEDTSPTPQAAFEWLLHRTGHSQSLLPSWTIRPLSRNT
jgi:hypothetical protein